MKKLIGSFILMIAVVTMTVGCGDKKKATGGTGTTEGTTKKDDTGTSSTTKSTEGSTGATTKKSGN